MTVRAKCRVNSIARTEWGHTVTLSPVTSGSPENESFFKATPGGKIELSVVNDATIELFGKPGDSFYVDFTKAE